MKKINKKIIDLFNEYEKENGREPLYACCEIQFPGEGSFYDTIKLSSGSGNDDDESEEGPDEDDDEKLDDDCLFYYCNNLNGLLSLTTKGVEDFIVKDVTEFFN